MGKIVEMQKEMTHDVVLMALDLWSDNTYEALLEHYEKILITKNETVFLAEVDENKVGFIHVSIRHDYVEGSNSSPVGYIEGIFVKPSFRGEHIAKKLVQHGEQWAKSQGCTQMGSDIEQENNISYEFHKNIGFTEANRLICFIKDIV